VVRSVSRAETTCKSCSLGLKIDNIVKHGGCGGCRRITLSSCFAEWCSRFAALSVLPFLPNTPSESKAARVEMRDRLGELVDAMHEACEALKGLVKVWAMHCCCAPAHVHSNPSMQTFLQCFLYVVGEMAVIGEEASRWGRKSHLFWPFFAGGEAHNSGDHSIKSHQSQTGLLICLRSRAFCLVCGSFAVTHDVLCGGPVALRRAGRPLPPTARRLSRAYSVRHSPPPPPSYARRQRAFYTTSTAALTVAGPPPARSSLAATTTTTAVAASSVHGATGRPAAVADALSGTPSVARAPAADVVAASALSAARPCGLCPPEP